MLEFRLLGTLEALNDGVVLKVPRGKAQTILAILLVSDGRAISTEEGIDLLWPCLQPRTARDAFYTYMTTLRKALTSTGAHDPVERADGGYRMAPGTYQLDVTRFDSLVSRGHEAAARGEPQTAWGVYTQAISLIRGDEPLHGIEHPALVTDEVRDLTEKAFTTRENWCDIGLRLGRCEEVLPVLRRLHRTDSLRERVQELLLIAEYQNGGQPRGLSVSDSIRRGVAEEAGLDPSDRLWWLQKQIFLREPAIKLMRPAGEIF